MYQYYCDLSSVFLLGLPPSPFPLRLYLPSLGGSHNALVIRALAEGIVVVRHTQIVSQLVCHRRGNLDQAVIGVLP